METVEQIKSRLEAAVPGANVQIVANDSPSGQRSLLVSSLHGLAVARFLCNDAELRLDYCSNATGIDWPEAELTEKVKVKKVVDGVEKEVEEARITKRPGYLEAVYHLYSMEKKHGPVIIRLRRDILARLRVVHVEHQIDLPAARHVVQNRFLEVPHLGHQI